MTNIEVEIRGPLLKDRYEKFKKVLESKGTYVKKGNRLSVMYFRDNIPKNSSDLKDEKVDLRLRITNRKPEVVLKYGSWDGSDARKEFNFPIQLSDFAEWINFFKCLNWSLAVIYANTLITYSYEGIEFTLVEIQDFGYTFEAEILVKDDKEIETAQKKIRDACSKLGLREYHEGEFEKQCDLINNTKALQYDFNKTETNIILDKFKDFF